MKSRMLMVCGLVLLAGVGQAWAHHSFSATYDAAQKVEIEGVVKSLCGGIHIHFCGWM
jgi:hypothetical protein